MAARDAAGAVASRPVVLITGCASGIGLAAARLFAGRGYRVYASMRRAQERGAALRAEAVVQGWTVETPELDVNSDASVSSAVQAMLAHTQGRLDVLINNAAYYSFGALEETTPDELRSQLETNVIGVLRVTRAVLPAMRARRSGAIVNVGSVSGLVALPVTGPYHMSKWAIEAMTETLRYELWPFGIRVACVEPGPFKTELHANEVQSAASRRPDSPYADLVAAYQRQSAALPRAELDAVLRTLWRASTHPRPKLRWPVGPTSFPAAYLRRFVPDAMYGWVVRLAFRIRRPPRV